MCTGLINIMKHFSYNYVMFHGKWGFADIIKVTNSLTLGALNLISKTLKLGTPSSFAEVRCFVERGPYGQDLRVASRS